MNNIEIFEQRIDDTHLTSYWYDGLIAKGETYELRAVGEIKYWGDEPNDDKDVIDKYRNDQFMLNNWFTINEIDGDYWDSDIYGNYDDAIKTLIKLEREQTNEQI